MSERIADVRTDPPRRRERTHWVKAPVAPQEFLDALPEDIHPLVGQLLWTRGVTDPAQVESFLQANYADLHDPLLLLSMDRAVERIKQARQHKQRIAVYGDFDTDGVTGVTLLYQALTGIGFDVLPYIPKRIEEGYGLNEAAVEQLASKVGLLITVDCGISNVAEIALAQSLGLDVIVLDHHTPPATLPDAYAIVNPKQPGCRYPYKMLAGVGIAFKLVQALANAGLKSGYRGRQLLDIVALGTVADMAPLDGENRVLVKYGLEALNATERPGLRALIEVAALRGPVNCRMIGWALGPRINAAGRLDDAVRAYELLMCDNHADARDLATNLDEINARRKGITAELFERAVELARVGGKADGRLIFLDGEGFPSGVVGLVAGRLAEHFGRPVLLLERGEESSRGSARSIPGFSIIEALAECADVFTKYGGHAMAAGFTLPTERIPLLEDRLAAIALRDLTDEMLERKLVYDAELPLRSHSLHLIDQIAMLEPFGQGNAEPVWVSHDLQVLESRVMGADHQHLRLRVRDDMGGFGTAVAWNYGARAEEFCERARVDIVYSLEADEWQGRRRIQMKVKHIKRTHGEQ
jgi:single-stranded-DNA-specific exonuclease